jgi:hypothetical protein
LLALAILQLAGGAFGQTNGILRELYTNLQGTSLADLTNAPAFPDQPEQEFIESSFEAPYNFSDYYGQRMRALLVPPVTGTYVFWISSDDNSVLFLSTDETPSKKVAIASVATWTASREWNKEANQKSGAINLAQGKRYYIEALQKEGNGGDSLAVTWQKPGDPVPGDGSAPIGGSFLVPYGLGPPLMLSQPTNATVVEGGTAAFAIQVTRRLGCTFQWRQDGVNVPGATNAVLTVGPVVLSDSGSTYSCWVTNFLGYTNSSNALLTVTPDVTRPVISFVANLGDPALVSVAFSEALEPASATAATNYTISDGVRVLSASFGPDNRTVILVTTPMAMGSSYVLTVSHVRDTAQTPNAIVSGSQVGFTLGGTPLDISAVIPNPEPVGPSSRRSPLTISEIMYHPADRTDGRNLEFIELYNSNPYVENISGFRISGEVDFRFPTNTFIAARAYLVVAASPADLQATYGISSLTGPYTNSLPNSQGTLRLRNRQDAVVFETTYSDDPPWPAAADGAGHSLVLARASLGEAEPAAWRAGELKGGSPGLAEVFQSSPFRTVLINEFLAHTDDPEYDYVELFNYGSSAVDVSGFILTDDADTNKFLIPTNTIIEPQRFLVYDERQLGFRLGASGQTIYFKDAGDTRVIEAIRYGAQENGVSTGRSPDGSQWFSRLAARTPGTANGPPRVSPVVINETMYDPISGEDDDQYVELFNRGQQPVDVGGWRLEGGAKYTVPRGTVLEPGGFLVIGRNAARLLTNYPSLSGIQTLGDFSGALSRGGERLALSMPEELVSTNTAGRPATNFVHIVVDEVTYGTGGRWGQWAHGGGSSLELIDARADHRLAPNWADSDETSKSQWTTIERTGVLDHGSVTPDSLQIILLGPGECLVDNVEVFAAGGANRIVNPGFESGLSGWGVQGNHEDSSLEQGTGFGGGNCLHIRATERGDTGANRIRTTLSAVLGSGQTVTLRARVRWLAGNPEILLRLKGNWLEATGNILKTRSLGTPGAPNSRSRSNVGPAITAVTHLPVTPGSFQPVTVSARVHDPDGLAALLLRYRIDPSAEVRTLPMANRGAGLFSATIPGQALGKIAAFSIQALDNFSPRAGSQFPADAPARECLVRWGDPAQAPAFGTYRLWMTQATFDRWSKREKLSNKSLDCTFVYNNRVIYNMGARYSGSPWHAPGYDTPTGNVCDYLIIFPEDDSLLGETEATLQWPGNGGGDNTYQREQTAYWLAEQMGLPWCNRRSVNLFINGVRRAEFFEDAQQPNGVMMDELFPGASHGDLHKIQLWFEFDDAAANFSAAGASLGNVTTTGGAKKLEYYRWTWAKRAVRGSASNFTNLFALVDAANYPGLGDNYRRQLENVIDIENWLKTYAIEHIVGNVDSFAYGGGQNMYTFKPPLDTWKMMIWDIDFAFAADEPTSDVFQGIGRSCGIDLGEPAYLRRYWQILQDLANGPLVPSRINPVLDARYNAMIAAGRNVENPASIKNYASTRRANLLSLISTRVPASFTLSSTQIVANANLVTISGTAPIDVRTITIDGLPLPVRWTSVSNWTAHLVLDAGQDTRLVQGLDAAGNPVPGAAVSLATTYLGAVASPQDSLVINEIMYDPAVANAGFLEIYNQSATTAFDLSGWRLEGADFAFPAGSIIGANRFLVIAADRNAFAQAYGSSVPIAGVFEGKLQNNGETLRLVKPGPVPAGDQVIDAVRYDSEPPWPSMANGQGASLQLIDPAQDNSRVGAWEAILPGAPVPKWRRVIATGNVATSSLYVYLQFMGDVYIDDMKLAAGSDVENSPNLLANGDFETAFPGPWEVAPNFSGSQTTTEVKHSGNRSLHMIAYSGGTTRGSVILQDMTPQLNTSLPHTLSFWFLENTNGGKLVTRFSSSSLSATTDIGPTPLPAFTPGAMNSVAQSLPAFPPIWLNEVGPQNLSGPVDRLGHRHPWVELFNPSSRSVDLAGLFLGNNYTNPAQWAFPASTIIPSNSFLVVWTDGNVTESTPDELHASFSLPPQSGSVALSTTNVGRTTVLDYLNYSLPQPDRSYGELPDGSALHQQAFYYVTPGATNRSEPGPLSVFINEWMADNATTLADPADDDFEDWFELYNPGPGTVYLSGTFLGTSLTNRTEYPIPDGYSIPEGGHLLVWADSESQNATNRSDLHVDFKLSKEGDAIGLFAANGAVIDFVVFGAQDQDLSNGRFPDGAGSISPLSVPTPREPNYLLLANTAPSLTPLANQSIFDGQLLALAVSASDADLPAQALTFSLEPGGAVGAFINPESGLFSWRPDSTQLGSWSFVVRVSDDGVPPMSATASFVVQVMPRPSFSAILPGPNGGCSLTFGSVPGQIYRIEYKDSLADPEWLRLGVDTLADAASTVITDDTVAGAQRFYRVVTVN